MLSNVVNKINTLVNLTVYFRHPGQVAWHWWSSEVDTDICTTGLLKSRATEPGLSAGMVCTQPNGRKHKNHLFYGDCTVKLLSTFDMMKRGTSQNSSSIYFHNSWIYVETMTPNVNFPVQGHTIIINKVYMVHRWVWKVQWRQQTLNAEMYIVLYHHPPPQVHDLFGDIFLALRNLKS